VSEVSEVSSEMYKEKYKVIKYKRNIKKSLTKVKVREIYKSSEPQK
jgi:hypothetical protein